MKVQREEEVTRLNCRHVSYEFLQLLLLTTDALENSH